MQIMVMMDPIIRCGSELIMFLVMQGYTNPGQQVAMVTTFCIVVPHICGSAVWKLLHVMLLAPRIGVSS